MLVLSDAYVLLCVALEKCTCGAMSVKKLGKTPQPHLPPPPRSLPPPPSPSSSTAVPPSPAAAALTPPIVDREDRAAAPSTPVVVEMTANKPRELIRGREETMGGEGESAPKRRKITPSPPPRSASVSAPSLTPPSTTALSAPVSCVVPTPEVAEVVQVAAKDVETAVDVPADNDRTSAAVSIANHHPHQSAPGLESDSTLPEPDPKPEPGQEQGPDLSAAATTGNDDVVPTPRKIGIQHIQLVYENVGETLQCRMCQYGVLPLAISTEITNVSSCSDCGSVS